MDRFESMQEWCSAQESILDRFRKTKLVKAPTPPNAQTSPVPSFANAAKYVEWLEKTNFSNTRADVAGFHVNVKHFENGPVRAFDLSYISTLVDNAVKAIPKIHKSICMQIIKDYKEGEKPWAWQERADKSISLADIEKEIRFNIVEISSLPKSIYFTYWFDDGQAMLYGGHSIIVSEPIGQDATIFDANGKYSGKPVNFDLAG